MAAITIHGKPLNTCGELPSVGASAPDFKLVNGKLAEVGLADFAGKKKLLCVVPSLDTPTCATSTRKFNEKADRLQDTVVLVVSADLPFAQGRFCETEGLKSVLPVSCFRSDFAEIYGVKLVDTFLAGLCARAMVLINAENRVVYTELVSEIADEPDYEAALEAIATC